MERFDAWRARAVRRRRVGFSAHMLAEYLLGAGLVVVALHETGILALALAVGGALLIGLNLFSVGPLGAVPLLGRRLHHLADLVLVGLLVLVPFAALDRLHPGGILGLELVAAVLVRIERGTSYEATADRRPAPTPGARRLGVAVGVARRRARRWLSQPPAEPAEPT